MSMPLCSASSLARWLSLIPAQRPSQLHDPSAARASERRRGLARPPPIGLGQARHAVTIEPNFEPPHLSLAQLHQRRRLSDVQLADQLGQDPGSSLLLAAYGDRLLHRWRLTNSQRS